MIETYGRNMGGSEPISILICSRNRREELEDLVSDLKRMSTTWSFEIVVVEETDYPVAIEGTRYVPHPVANRGFPYARNLALQNASGDIIVFVDDDCHIHDGWLDNLLEPFRDDSVVGVQGGVTVPSDTNAIGWAESILGFPGGGIRRVLQAEGEIQETREISTLNCAYRKWVLDKLGGFDERLRFGGEDYLLPKKAAKYGKCVFVPRAIVDHRPRGNLRDVFLWFYRRGRAEILLARTDWQPKKFFWYWLRNSITAKILAVLFFSWLISLMSYGICILAGCYVLLKITIHYKVHRHCNATFKSLLVLPLVKSTMDLGIDCGRFRGLVSTSLTSKI